MQHFTLFARTQPPAPLLPVQANGTSVTNNHHPAACRKWLGGKDRKIQTSSTGGAGCTSHVIAKQELTLEVAVNGIAAKFVSACHAAADLAVEPTMNKELSLSWRLYMTEQDCTNKDKVIATLQDQSRADRLAADQRLADLEAAHGCELAKADLAVRVAKTREAAQAKGFQQAKQAAEAAETKAAAADDTAQAALAAHAASEKENRSLKRELMVANNTKRQLQDICAAAVQRANANDKEVLNLQQQARQGRIQNEKLTEQVQMLQASQGQPINLHQPTQAPPPPPPPPKAAAAPAAVVDSSSECLGPLPPLYPKVSPLPPLYPKVSPKPWPGALSRAIKAEAQVAALQVQVRDLSQLLAERDNQSEGQHEEQPSDGGVTPAVRTSENLNDDPEQGGMSEEYDDDLDDVIAQQAAVASRFEAWLECH